MDGDDPASPPPPCSQRQRCEVCNECFPDGRSLSGHMRSHVGEAKERRKGTYSLRDNPKKTRRFQLSHFSDDDKDMYWCGECGKAFHSSGGLTKHKRCHSDSAPRIAPELEGRPTNAAGTGGQHDVDVWAATVLQTMNRSKSTSPASNDGRDAAVNPVLPPEDVESSASSNKGFTDLETDESKNEDSDASFSVAVAKQDDHEVHKKQEHDVLGAGGSNANTVAMDTADSAASLSGAVAKKDGHKLLKRLEHHVRSASRTNSNTVSMKPGVDETDADGISSDMTLFKCVYCKETFSSYQALGDHRARYKNGGCRY